MYMIWKYYFRNMEFFLGFLERFKCFLFYVFINVNDYFIIVGCIVLFFIRLYFFWVRKDVILFYIFSVWYMVWYIVGIRYIFVEWLIDEMN